MARSVVFAGILVEAVVDGIPPLVRLLVGESRREQGDALERVHVFRRVGPGRGDDGGGIVDVLHHRVVARACGNLSGPFHDERHAE